MSPTPLDYSVVMPIGGGGGGSLTGGDDGESGINIAAGLFNHANPLCRSASERYPSPASGYHNNFPNASSSRLPTTTLPLPPPSYDEAASSKLPPSRFRIEPREEEGNEELPSYSCSIHREAIFKRKLEMKSPFDRSKDRGWGKIYVVLHGTLLTLHKPKRIPLFGSKRKTIGTNGYLPGELLQSYTLQLAEVGIASDYRKKHYVIRVRAQTEQFLFSCKSVEIFIDWLEALSAAVDLSPALEERSLPRYQTLPRRRRRRRPGQFIAEQEAIIRRDFPHLANTRVVLHPAIVRSINTTTNGASTQSGGATPVGPVNDSENPLVLEAIRLGIFSPSSNRCASRAQPVTPAPPPTGTATNNLHEEQDSTDVKWAPRSSFSVEAHLRCARRCMATLCADAPRQTDFVVVDGKRYRLHYERNEMVLDERPQLPSYKEIVGKGSRRAEFQGEMST